ncbi:cytochrome P450 4B1-like [Mizuhopecten yessoensis]|uniref:Cytochrome P450 4B1 n=1 Tax=Mizuhopecten yessoensis TaxID=6573 RepID=A0A210PY31_MIZYE|nr:cytochrome P450 4B1-like [Mizuhopecten yessoensis]XP_021372227.1 cytochrome P450 4B1-like [Mizuhopecten yessoensis]OWF41391.1 Cytochrome P450 4B1 [Mizuhopecten yessoensis]
MDTTLQIVSAIVIGYVLWVVIPALWRYRALCRMLKNYASPGPLHPLWGHIKCFDDDYSVTSTYDKLAATSQSKMAAVWLAFKPLIQAVHPDTAKIILQSSDPKPTGRGHQYNVLQSFIGEGLSTSNGSKWLRNRKLLTPAFHFDILRPYVKVYNEVADILLNKYAAKMATGANSIDITKDIGLATLDTILRCALSYEGNIQEQEDHPYPKTIHRISELIIKRFLIPWHLMSWNLYMLSAAGKDYKRCIDYVHGFAEKIIAKRRRELADDPSLLTNKKRMDFLDILMTAKDKSGAGLTDEEIRDEVDTFMFAGHDTSYSALIWALYHMGKYPEEQEAVYREVCDVTGDRQYVEWEDLAKLQKTTMFLKENLRLYTPAATTTRLLTKPMELEGHTFPAGTAIGVNFAVLHRNPEVYDDPKEFRPERFLPENAAKRSPFAFIPFAAGPRNCIGQNFTMNEQKVILSRIVKRFKVVLDEDHVVLDVPRLVIEPRYGIKVRLEERQ